MIKINFLRVNFHPLILPGLLHPGSFLLIAGLFFLTVFSYAQPRVVWDSTYGGSSIEAGYDIARVPGGFIIAGKCSSNDFNVQAATDPDGSGNHSFFGIVPTEDFWVAKLDNNGRIIWQNSLGGTGTEEITSVVPTSDGGYILAGFLGGTFGGISATGDVATPDADGTGVRGGFSDIWIVKLDATGIMQWHNIIGGSNYDFAADIIQTSDGGYLVIGDTYSNDLDAAAILDVDGSGRHGTTLNPDIWVLKLSPNGIIQWSNLLGGSSFDYGSTVIETAGGYLIAGTSSSVNGDLALPDVDGTPTRGNYDFWVAKLDYNGNVVWDNAIGGTNTDCLYASPGIIATSDGNYLLVGRSNSTNGDASNASDVDGSPHHGNADYWAVKIDPSGNIMWHNHIGTSAWDEIKSAHIACDGGIILSGYSESVAANGNKTRANPNGMRSPWLVKLSNNGQIEWDYAFSSAGPNFDGPNPFTTQTMTEDYYVITDSLGGDYFVLTTSNNPPGADKTAPPKGSYDAWLLKFTFEVTADFVSNTACFGTPTQFTDQSQFTNLNPVPVYQWNFGDPASGASNTSTAANPSHLYTAPGTYTVTQIIRYECKYDTIVKTAFVPEPPSVNFPATFVCNGSSVTLTANVNPGGGNYSWLPGGQNTPSIVVSPTANTTYSLVYTAANGCTSSAATTVTVNPVPTLTISSQNNVLCNGGSTGSATVNVISGPAPFNYSWNPGGQLSATATSLSAQTYTSTVTDANGCSSAITATISEPAVLQAFIPSQNDVICYGGSTGWARAGQLGGTPPYNYQWNPTNQTVAIATNLPFGTYTVTISDNNGCTAQRSTVIAQEPAITATVTVNNNPLCFGDATGALSVALTNGTAPYTYIWNPGGHSTTAVTGLTAGNYSVAITDVNGCTASGSEIITEPPLLTMTLSSTPDHCLSGDGTATIEPAGGTLNYTYSWAPLARTTAAVTGLSAGTYTATLTDNNGCSTTASVAVIPIAVDTLSLSVSNNVGCNGSCDGSATMQLSGLTNGPYVYSWNTVPSQHSLSATGLCTGTYVLTATDANNCKDTMSVFISEPPLLTATLTSNPTLCFGDNTGTATVNASGGTPSYTFDWQDGQTSITATGLSSGTYSVTITDNNGCTIMQAVPVADAPQLVVYLLPPASVCAGQQATLSSNVAGGTPSYNYLWNTMQNTPGITTTTLSATTGFTLTVTDNNGCIGVATTTILVNSLPETSFSSNIISGCKPLCIDFSNTTPQSQQQLWSFGDGSTSALANPNYCYTQTGSYNVSIVVTDNNGCTNSVTQNNYITVYPDPEAAFTFAPEPATILNSTIYFSGNSQGITGWNWSFGDVAGSSSTQQNTNYTYNDTGNYFVRLVVINEFGCRDTVENIIRINPDFVLYIPNTFTPNGDGINDLFIPVGIGVDIDEYELMIYDRWGTLIFQSTHPDIGWDGRVNGKIVQTDVYVWKVVTKDVLKRAHRYVGHVNLLK